MQYVCAKFKQSTHHKCKITTATTGHLYAQSMFGSSYAMMIGSNSTYSQGLINAGKANEALRLNLAISPLVLWSANESLDENGLRECLLKENGPAVHIADPNLAGFGEASKLILDKCHSWKSVQKR